MHRLLTEPADPPAEMRIMAKRQPCTNQPVHFIEQNVTIICYTPAATG